MNETFLALLSYFWAHFQHKAFAEVFLDDTHTPSNCHISVTVNAPVLGLAVRFPIPDLRSDQERGPWFKKSLQKEELFLELQDLEIKTEFMGGSSANQTKMELTFKELTGVSLVRFPLEERKCDCRTAIDWNLLSWCREVSGGARSSSCPFPQGVPQHGRRHDDV